MRSKLLPAAALSAALLLVTQAHAETLVIGIDVSLSVPLISNAEYAKLVAGRVQQRIGKLNIGDSVHLRTFGSSATADNLRRLDVTISRRNRAPDIATSVASIIRAIPKMMEDGKMKAQKETDLIAFLESQAKGLDCKKQPAEILLLTDGVQHSLDVNGDALIKGQAKLPTPAKDLLAGCHLKMLGLGQMANGANGVISKRLEVEWDRWSKVAGAQFDRLPD